MVAVGKGYSLTVSDVSWILGLVSIVAAEKAPATGDFSKQETQKLDCQSIFCSPYRDFIYAIGLRRSFGGTAGDVALLNNLVIGMANDKIDPALDIDVEPVLPIDFQSSLVPEEWELAAIDFHVCDVIQRWKQELASVGGKSVSQDFLKQVMWSCSSGVTDRHQAPVDPLYLAFWNRHEGMVRRLQREILLKHSTNLNKIH